MKKPRPRIDKEVLDMLLFGHRLNLLLTNLLVQKGVITLEELNEVINKAGIGKSEIRPSGNGDGSQDPDNS